MFGNSRAAIEPQVARKQKRRKSRANRQSALRLEQLEERLTLSSNPTLSIPTTLVGARNGVVAVPINVNQLTDNLGGSLISAFSRGDPTFDYTLLDYVNCTRAGLSSADFAIDFDPNVFSVSKSDVRLGTIPRNVNAFIPSSLQPNATFTPTGWLLNATISPTNPGQLYIHMAASTKFANITSTTATSVPTSLSDTGFGTFTTATSTGPVVGSIDSLVMIDFHIKPNAVVGKTQINLAASNALGTKPTEMFDATGRLYTLGPAPTNGSVDVGVDGTLNVLAAAPAIGTWMPVALTTPPTAANVVALINAVGLGTMLQLPDGSIMANGGFDQPTPFWFKLTPDANGNYATGTWTQLASMNLGRLFYGSVVMQDGRVMVLGGEFTDASFGQAEDPSGEIYDPATDTWTPIAPFPQPLFDPNIQSQNPPPAQVFGDGELELMSDGSVLAQFLDYKYGTTQSPAFRYYPGQDLWVEDASLPNRDRGSEEHWVKLADGSLLAYLIHGTHPADGARLIFGATPAEDQWVPAGHSPVNLSTNINELGPAVLLPDGRVFQIGATSNTALYTPPTPGNPAGTWTAGPLIPGGLGANDAPAAVMPNGRVLFMASSTPNFTSPPGASIFEFDPLTNTINKVTNLPATLAANLASLDAFNCRMLVLPPTPGMPSGQIMFNDSSGQAYIYAPADGPQDSWRPTISDITQNGSVYTLTGTQINGLNEGAYYGDDAQMATNYPIVELITPAGVVTFATTSNWSSAWVATGSTPQTVDFTLPNGTTLNNYASLRVIANGISSVPTNQIITLGATSAENVTVRVVAGNPALVEIVNTATNVVITTHPNNANWGTINIVGDASNNQVTIDEINGIVNAPVHFDGGGSGSPANDQLVVVGAAGLGAAAADNLVITPTSDTTANITDKGSATYSFENITKFLFDGRTGTNAVTLLDTLGGASMNVNGSTADFHGGTPFPFTNTTTLRVNDNSAVGGDTINVLSTAIPTTVGSTAGAGGDTSIVTSDAPSNQFGDLSGIATALTVATGAGSNTLIVSDVGSSTATLTFALTNKQITATDMPMPIAYSKGAGTLNIVLDGSNFVATTFTVVSTLPATNSVTLNAGTVDGNAFNIGSTAAANNGKLNNIGSAITVNGGSGAGNSLEVNDHGTIGAFNYNVTDTTVVYDFPTSPAAAAFGGVTYSGIQTLRLDATEQPNKFNVAPSFTTTDTINGYGQLGGVDSLAITPTDVSGPITNHPVPKPGSPGSFNGNFTFVDGHLPVNYTDIETFPAGLLNVPILAYAADSGPSSRPVVNVVNAQTGQLLSSFLAYEPGYTGGVSVAVGFFDGTGQPEIAVAPGRNHSPTIEVFDAFGNLIFQFQAYAANFINGISITAGNVENLFAGGHELDDIVTAPTRGVSDIRVFHNQFPTTPATPMTLLRQFTAWSTGFIGGSTVAVANLKPTIPGSWGDIIVGSGPGMTGTINVYDVQIPRRTYAPFKSFVPFGTAFRGGINVSAVNPQPNSNITAPVIVASQASAGTGQVKVLNALTGATQYTKSFGVNAGVRTASKLIGGRLTVFAAVPVSGHPSKIVRIDPLAPSMVDFILESDPAFNRMFVG